MRTLLILLASFIFLPNLVISQGQEPDPKLTAVAEKFLDGFLQRDYEKCWKLMDRKNVPDLNKETMGDVLGQQREILKDFDSFKLSMHGVAIAEGKAIMVYSYEAQSSSKEIVDHLYMDILFFPGSKLVAGCRAKIKQRETSAKTTSGKETQIQGDTTIYLENTAYKINGINVVHFTGEEDLVTIQVACKLPSASGDIGDWAQKEAVKFARFVEANGYLEKAKIIASENGEKLLETIGVSFFDKSIEKGYNVILKPEEFR